MYFFKSWNDNQDFSRWLTATSSLSTLFRQDEVKITASYRVPQNHRTAGVGRDFWKFNPLLRQGKRSQKTVWEPGIKHTWHHVPSPQEVNNPFQVKYNFPIPETRRWILFNLDGKLTKNYIHISHPHPISLELCHYSDLNTYLEEYAFNVF